MWRVGRTDTFLRTARRYLRRRLDVRGLLPEILAQLARDPFHPMLKAHALKGKLRGLHGVSVTYKIRLIVKIDPAARTVMLLDIGDHDAVYR